MIKRKVGVMLLVTALMTCVFSTTAFAQVKEDINAETTAETSSDDKKEESKKEEPKTEKTKPEESKSEELPPLTPEGNLNLVDDIVSEYGKQFITVSTKSGNYFYILIDRDYEGNQKVHFLNLVDESDLLALMDEEKVAEYQSAVEAEKETTVVEPKEKEEKEEPESEPEPIEKPVDVPKKKFNANYLPIAALLILVAAAGGGYFYLQTKKKKKEAEKPDPDADYEEEDELELPEEEDDSYDEEIEDAINEE